MDPHGRKPSVCSIEPDVHITAERMETLTEGAATLIGGRCAECGRLAFPKRMCCPFCYHDGMVDAALSSTGVIEACTTIYQAPSGYTGEVPYTVAAIKLDDDVRVLAQLRGNGSEWQIGQRVSSFVARTPGNSGTQYVHYAFHASDSPRVGS